LALSITSFEAVVNSTPAVRLRSLLPLTAILLVLLGQTCSAAEPDIVEAKRGMVVSVSPPGTDVGLEILKQGGNAVDAAVATAFALAVTHPAAGNIGGGGFMMIHRPQRNGEAAEVVCIEYRETAPAAATATMFSPDDSSFSHKIVGVPGTVRGLELAHRRYGRLPWQQLLRPAVRLASEGFPVDASLAKDLNRLLADRDSQRFNELLRVFAPPAGKPQWQPGDRLIQPDLASTLAKIAAGGADAFYLGPIADQIVAEMQSGEGLITKSDLAAYEAKARTPIHGTYCGYDVYGPPPPSSGGICLIEMLNILEGFKLLEKGRWSPEAVHLIVEAMRRAYCDRARHLGDADFIDIPDHLTSKAFAQQYADAIDPDKATPSESLAPEIQLAGEGPSTTHFSVIDSDGMAVSNTYTLEHSYGSRVVVRGAGFLLNNEMGDFNWLPGVTNRRGRIGTPANIIEPGKRMLSSQTPTIVARDGRPVLIVGSPGGRTIINTVLQIVLNVLEFEMDLRAAVDAPRLHHPWFPDEIRFEAAGKPEYAALLDGLRARGHKISDSSPRQGDAHCIWVDPQTGAYHGVADRRITGKAAGW
jgi:gamma-glutamyltranspeptidase/glutathione hydrolase